MHRNISISRKNRQLETLKKSCYKNRKQFQKERNERERIRKKAIYQKSRVEYNKAVVKAKYESWHSFVETKSQEDIWKLLEVTKNRNINRNQLMTTSKQHGTSTWAEVADLFLRYFFQRDNSKEDTPLQAEIRTKSKLPSGVGPSREVEDTEVVEYLRALKRRVSPGLDSIENGGLKMTADLIAPRLTIIYKACLKHGVFPAAWKRARLVLVWKNQKGNRGNPALYRPLSLISTMWKTFEHVLKDRINQEVVVSRHQYGFRKFSSTTNAIQYVTQTIKDTKRKLGIIILIDIKAAFDRVWWPHVLERLRTKGCPTDVQEVIRDYLRDRRVVLRNGAMTREIKPERGCPQGSVLGPTLWNIVFDELLETLDEDIGITPVTYADDLTIIVTGNSKRQVSTRAQAAMNKAYRWCAEYKMEISDSKTSWIIAKGTFKEGMPEILTQTGKRIQKAESVKYLGVWFDQNLKFHTHCLKVAEKAKKAFLGYRALAKANWGVGHGQLSLMYRTIFVPMVTYAAGAWGATITLADKRKLVTAQRTALITVTRAYCTVSTPMLLVLASVRPISFEIQKEILRYHVRESQEIKINGILYDPIASGATQLMEELEDRQNQEWQKSWEDDMRGRSTFEFFPSIPNRDKAKWIECNYYTTQLLSGHGNFRSKLRKFNSVKDDKCQCGQVDTLVHTFFECARFTEQRREYRSLVIEAGATWPLDWQGLVSEKIMPLTAKYVINVLKDKEKWDKERQEQKASGGQSQRQ